MTLTAGLVVLFSSHDLETVILSLILTVQNLPVNYVYRIYAIGDCINGKVYNFILLLYEFFWNSEKLL